MLQRKMSVLEEFLRCPSAREEVCVVSKEMALIAPDGIRSYLTFLAAICVSVFAPLSLITLSPVGGPSCARFTKFSAVVRCDGFQML
jgi:hypothetical protein